MELQFGSAQQISTSDYISCYVLELWTVIKVASLCINRYEGSVLEYQIVGATLRQWSRKYSIMPKRDKEKARKDKNAKMNEMAQQQI